MLLLAQENLTWYDRLLGLEQFSAFSEDREFALQHALPAWGWAIIVVAAVAYAGWSYYRLLGPKWARVLLAGVRVTLILLVALLLAGPMLVLKREKVEPDTLIVLFDRSPSLNIRDMRPAGDEKGDYITRDDAMRRALEAAPEIFSDENLGGEYRRILWLGFEKETFEVSGPKQPKLDGNGGAIASDDSAGGSNATTDGNEDPSDDGIPVFSNLPPPQGQTTAIRTAIEQAVQRVGGKPIAGVVMFTDGRSPQSTGTDLIRRLNQQDIRVFSVPLGAEKMPLDLAIARVDHPAKAFINDVVPVTVFLESYGDADAVEPSRVTVKLIDEATGDVLDQQNPAAPGEAIRLQNKSKAVGETKWRVEVEYENIRGDENNEIITENNDEVLAVELVDRPIRVLLVDGYPRWEFRYLKNLLIREKSIASSTLLLSADAGFAQEGDIPIKRVPKDAKEIEPFDVIIIGDVPSRYFGADMMTMIREHTAVRGAGLMWIGGDRFTPRTYETTPLADLLPMRAPATVGRVDPALGMLQMEPTELAKALNVLRIRPLGVPPETVVDKWPEEIPPLQWAQDLGPLKPTAEVLARTQPLGDSAGWLPLVVRLRYGAGQAMYMATDETWRWRYGRGEYYFEQYWVQLIRMLGRHRLQQDQGPVRLTVSRRQVQRDQTVVLELNIRDEALASRNLPSIRVDVAADEQLGAPAIEQVELRPVNAEDYNASQGDPLAITTGLTYRAEWQPRTTGKLTLGVSEPGLFDLDIKRQIDVYHPDDENRQPMPDHPRLAQLSEETGGQVVALDQLTDLTKENVVPRREVRTPNDIHETIWDSYLALILVLLLATVEWVGRKMIRLV